MQIDKKKRAILLIIISIVVIVITVLTTIYFINSNKNTYGEELKISNLDTYTKDKPKDKHSIDYIKYDLLRTVNKNVKTPVNPDSVKDVFIREGTFDQVLNKNTDVYSVKFIVDIESLRQSYYVSYQWSSDGGKENLIEGATAVRCLPPEQLKYGDFNCKDMFIELSTPTDPILEHLPYSSIDFKITYDATAGKVLNATIYTTAADERINSNAAIEKYKKDINQWITSIGLDPNNYTINYTIIRASLY